MRYGGAGKIGRRGRGTLRSYCPREECWNSKLGNFVDIALLMTLCVALFSMACSLW